MSLLRIAGGAALAVALLSLPTGLAHAQAAQVTTDVGPHYVGEAVSIRITAVGFDENPAPKVDVPAPDSGRLDFVGVSPSVNQSITIVNGKMTRTREVTHVFQYRFVPDRAGNLRIGPFAIRHGTRATSVPSVRLKIQDVPSNDDVRVALTVPSGQIFVGERVPVTVTFTLEAALQENALGYKLQVPFFDEQSAFRFLEQEPGEGDTNVVINTGSRQVELRGESREISEGGKRFVAVSVTRTMVPLAPGKHRVPPVNFSVEEGVRFRRDFFGGRRATQVRRWSARDPGRGLEVAAIPGREQPASFGGAIGRGFTLEVTADRTVVQVGDPITLTFLVRGEGLETASLPALDAEGLLPVDSFRVPADVPTGELDRDVKRFTAVVRVLDDGVREVPALAYSWFDPDSKQFETTLSRPIALSVRAAEVIGARDVQIAGAEDGAGPGEPTRRDDEAPRSRTFALTGADLAIETAPAAVLGSRASGPGAWWVPSLYAGSVALVALALFDRRRRQVDPEQVRRRRVLAGEVARIRAAGALAPADGARQIGEAIRLMLREMPRASNADLDRLLGECDARSYAPSGDATPLEPEFVSRAVELAEDIARKGGSEA